MPGRCALSVHVSDRPEQLHKLHHLAARSRPRAQHRPSLPHRSCARPVRPHYRRTKLGPDRSTATSHRAQLCFERRGASAYRWPDESTRDCAATDRHSLHVRDQSLVSPCQAWSAESSGACGCVSAPAGRDGAFAYVLVAPRAHCPEAGRPGALATARTVARILAPRRPGRVPRFS